MEFLQADGNTLSGNYVGLGGDGITPIPNQNLGVIIYQRATAIPRVDCSINLDKLQAITNAVNDAIRPLGISINTLPLNASKLGDLIAGAHARKGN